MEGDMMSIQVNEGDHKFYVGDDAQAPDAEITYTFVDAHTIDVNHTFVDPSLRGHGVAKQLFNAVIKKAQEEDLKIIPSCSYVHAQFERDTSLAHLKKS
nr:GNAT family N-acetyltransferase [Staphylococcus agnetis]